MHIKFVSPLNSWNLFTGWFQALDITIKDCGIMGIPFVLRSGESWIKNNDSDFYISVEAEKKPRKVPKFCFIKYDIHMVITL